MEQKNILGLDIGTNSIGWAVVNVTDGEDGTMQAGRIVCAGSRIIPMDADTLGKFDKGNSTSQTEDRTKSRATRRLYERAKLRRDRLHRVLAAAGFLPEHYARRLDRYGKFLPGCEPKLPWERDAQGGMHFIFRESFDEMLADFRNSRPDLMADGQKIAYDWTIYYLRKKALTEKVRKEELAWILLNFNRKRGYHQLRDDEEEQAGSAPKTRQQFERQTVTDITDTGETYKGLKVLLVSLENGLKGKIFRKDIPDWIGQKKDIIVTVDIDKEGNDKHDDTGSLSCRFRIPTEQEWEEQWKLVKTKTQNELDASGKTVGAYIYDTLLQTPDRKIRGKLVRTIDRKYYKDELRLILERQKEFHPELSDRHLFEACINELYPQNDAHRNLIGSRDLAYLITEDILFYQRPLKSKKSLIADCPYESHSATDRDTGEQKHYGVKCIAKSHPLFQEFRLWQFISNLRIYEKEQDFCGQKKYDVDVTNSFLKDENDYADLFDRLSRKESIGQADVLECLGLKKKSRDKYRWNFGENKNLPGNETRSKILRRLDKAGVGADFLTREREEALWHILYSIADKAELQKALATFARKQGLGEAFVEAFVDAFKNMPPFKKDYGAYSAKAIKKLLPLMRMGRHWSESDIDGQTCARIDKITSGEYDESIRTRAREKAIRLTDISSFRGLPLWLACYVVYDRHSEAKDIGKWERPSDIDGYLKNFKQHSLHNPIVEQVILETLRTVRDIWQQTGHIDEIHVELGREMKNPNKKREEMSRRIQENENTNIRIKAMLTEFMNPKFEIENVRPHSPSQQDLLRIYEEGVLKSVDKVPDDISDIIKKLSETDIKKRPTTGEVMRYKLWLEQKYRSPYTGEIIPLGKLFTPAYEIEHIIPQARYFDDSLSNKVICEAEVNKEKGSMLGCEFIKEKHGMVIPLSLGGTVKIRSEEEYRQFVKGTYSHNPAKMKKLLMEEIPDQFTARQLNDSRYISKLVKALLSNIVREEGEQEETSKHVIVCTGGVTDRLKKDWGVNDVWNRILLPRFRRLNELKDTAAFNAFNAGGNEMPAMPLEYQKGFSKKRIDHRHHAMDAIIIACANRNIVNYLNNEWASKDAEFSRYDLQHLLCDKQKTDDNGNYRWLVRKPWDTFTQDVYNTLQGIIVSFKQNLRVINKTTNHYLRYTDGQKKPAKQDKGDSWAIRKSLHKDTVYGKVNLRLPATAPLKEVLREPNIIVEKDLKKKLKELLSQGRDEKQIKKYFESNADIWQDVDLKKIKVYRFSNDTKDKYFATRKPLGTDFTREKIKGVTDTGIRKILLRHLDKYGNDAEQAFSPEGIEEMNKNIVALNDGKQHKPIYKVRICEKGEKFPVGQRGNKPSKFVEADKGTNLYFAIYEAEPGKRTYATIPLNEVIDRLKRGLPPAPEDSNGIPPKFVLSPNDLVYVPTKEELAQRSITRPMDRTRIYKMVSCNKSQCFFIQANIANVIVDKYEYSSQNKMEKAISGEMIKEICIPIRVDRLGNITKTETL